MESKHEISIQANTKLLPTGIITPRQVLACLDVVLPCGKLVPLNNYLEASCIHLDAIQKTLKLRNLR